MRTEKTATANTTPAKANAKIRIILEFFGRKILSTRTVIKATSAVIKDAIRVPLAPGEAIRTVTQPAINANAAQIKEFESLSRIVITINTTT